MLLVVVSWRVGAFGCKFGNARSWQAGFLKLHFSSQAADFKPQTCNLRGLNIKGFRSHHVSDRLDPKP